MAARDPSTEGFIVGARIVYSVIYDLDGGSALIVWFDREGNDLNGRVRHSDAKRRIMAARLSDVILYLGQPRRVVSLRTHRENRLAVAW
jgi:hypothetical protein